MTQKKISLIIPAYNEEKYIGPCLEHVIKHSRDTSGQSRFHEIIVVNNASSDNTHAVAESFKGVKVVHEPKKGLTRARQRGLEEATGDILAYIDADTRMPDYWLDVVEKEFSKNPDLAALSGPYYYYDLPAHHKMWVKLYWWILGMPTYFITRYMIIGGNFAIRKNVLEKMSGFDTSIAFYGEDTNIARRAKAHGKVKFTLKLYMPTSGRRLKGQGTFSMARIYVLNYISEVLFKKPYTRDYTDIR
jgi:glycosyltransferase involved in cell wall biosynthesis